MDINKQLDELKMRFIEQEVRIDKLKQELSEKDEIINSFPQLSATSFGKSTSDGKIIYRNWWASRRNEFYGFCDEMWFTRFLKFRFPDADYKFNFFSVFGTHDNIMNEMDGKKIFFSGENLNKTYVNFNKTFGDYALDYVDLAMGYDLIDHPKYLRFPLWLLFSFEPEVTDEIIENMVEYWCSLNFEKTRDVANISSHDNGNTRKLIANDIEGFVNITYGGSWRNNTSDLWEVYNDSKFDFLKDFKFNICSENILDDGYVTEKVFDAIKTDSIPLYAGGGNYLEPEVLNHKAIIIWDFDKDNSDSVELFRNLITDEKSYTEFKEQNILLESSSKFIIRKFSKLEKHFEHLIY